MTFAIDQLAPYKDKEFDAETEQALSNYSDELMALFRNSPEGQARLQEDPDLGFWAGALINYGYTHESVTLPEMSVSEVRTLLTSVFPRKISIKTPDDADAAVPELIAFWQYLKREYQLAQADDVLAYLQQIGPEFKQEMNNPDNFDIAKSFMAAGREAGFDMSTPEGIQAFQQFYNDNLALPDPAIPGSGMDALDLESADAPTGLPGHVLSKADKAKRKKQRKIAKASRQQNRRRKK
jgi:hypothetical protein